MFRTYLQKLLESIKQINKMLQNKIQTNRKFFQKYAKDTAKILIYQTLLSVR